MEYHGTWTDDQDSIHYHSEQLLTNQINQSETIRDGMIIPKQNTTTRIYCQNTNGISVGQNSNLEVILKQVRHMEIDILVITEMNLATDKSKVRAKMYDKF
jgi:hypothetical protein